VAFRRLSQPAHSAVVHSIIAGMLPAARSTQAVYSCPYSGSPRAAAHASAPQTHNAKTSGEHLPVICASRSEVPLSQAVEFLQGVRQLKPEPFADAVLLLLVAPLKMNERTILAIGSALGIDADDDIVIVSQIPDERRGRQAKPRDHHRD